MAIVTYDPDQEAARARQRQADKPVISYAPRRKTTFANGRFYGEYNLTPDEWKRNVGIQKPKYFEQPQTVARYYHTLKALPPGAEPPPWLNREEINFAYDYLNKQNNGAPWWQWKFLNPADPGRQFLRNIQQPPDDSLWPGEEKYKQQVDYQPAKPETLTQPAMGGMTEADYGRLQPWQKALVWLGGQGAWAQAGAMGGAIGAGSAIPGAIAGFAAGGPIGAAIGAVAAPTLIGLGLGSGLGALAQTAPGMANLLMKLDYPAEWLERSFGVLGLGYGRGIEAWQKKGFAASSDAVADVLNNLPAAFKAAHLTYETLPIGRTWQATSPIPEVNTGWASFNDAYERIRDGEKPEDVYQDISARMGITGQGRELLGHILLDPLNVLGGLGLLGELGLAVVKGDEALKTATLMSRGPVDALRQYGAILRATTPSSDIAKMGSLAQWLGGVTKAGEATDVVNKGGKGIFNYLFSLTPQTRATEVVNQSSKLVSAVLEKAVGPAGEFDPKLAAKQVHSLANTPMDLARELSMRALRAPDAAALPLALKDNVEIIDNIAAGWEAAQPRVAALNKLAELTGREIEDIVVDLGDEAGASRLLGQLQDLAAKSNDPAAKELLLAMQGGQAGLPGMDKLDGKALVELAKPFQGKDGVPFRPEMVQAQMHAALEERVAQWAVDWFGVKPDPGWVRMGNTVKAAQSLVLLGFNPVYFLNNSINNLVTVASEGLFGMRSSGAIRDIWARAGITPPRLKAGLGVDASGIEQAHRVIREASAGEGALEGITQGLNKTKRFQVFGRLSGWNERASSEQAVTSGFMQAMARMWKPDTGFARMPGPLEERLAAIHPDLPNAVYASIREGMNQAEIEQKLWQGLARRSVGAATPEIARRTGIPEADVTEALNAVGVTSPEFTGRLATAADNAEVGRLMAEIESKASDHLDKLSAQNLELEASKAAARVGGEGAQAALEIFDQMSYDYSEHWFNHFVHMDEAAQVAESVGGDLGSAARGLVWENAFADARRSWDRLNQRQEAQMAGIAKGLGLDSDTGRRSVGYLQDQHSTWSDFYKFRDDQYRAFGRGESSWDEVGERIGVAWEDAYTKQETIFDSMDTEYVNLFASQFGEQAGQVAAAWRKGIKDIRQKMHTDMLEHRAMGAQSWREFLNGPYFEGIRALYDANVEGARQMWSIATGRAAPGAPAAPQQPQFADIDWKLGGNNIQAGRAEQQARRAAIEDANLKVGEVRRIAAELAPDKLSTALPDGTARNVDPYILNVINKYGEQKYTDLAEVEPEAARKAIAAWQENNAAEAAKAEEIRKAQIALDMEQTLRATEAELEKQRIEGLQAERMAASDRAWAELPAELEAAFPGPASARKLYDEGEVEKVFQMALDANKTTSKQIIKDVPELAERVNRARRLQDNIYSANLEALPDDIQQLVDGALDTMYGMVEAGIEGHYEFDSVTGKFDHAVDSTFPAWYGETAGSYKGMPKNKDAMLEAIKDIRAGNIPEGRTPAIVSRLMDVVKKAIERQDAYSKAMGAAMDVHTPVSRLEAQARAALIPQNLDDLFEEVNVLQARAAEYYGGVDFIPQADMDMISRAADEIVKRYGELDIIENPPKPDPYIAEQAQLQEAGKVAQADWVDDVEKVIPPVERDYTEMVPGTPEWMDYWRAHPEEQTDMLEYRQTYEVAKAEGREPTIEPIIRTETPYGGQLSPASPRMLATREFQKQHPRQWEALESKSFSYPGRRQMTRSRFVETVYDDPDVQLLRNVAKGQYPHTWVDNAGVPKYGFEEGMEGHRFGATANEALYYDFLQANARQAPTTLEQPPAFGKPQQMGMFGAGEDLPLMTGTPMQAKESVFTPQEAARQGTLFDMRPQPKGAIEGGEAAGPLFDAAIQVGQIRKTLRQDFISYFLSGQESVLAGVDDAGKQADAVLALLDAHANVWAKKMGKTPLDWYQTHVAGVSRETPGGTYFQQAGTAPVWYSQLQRVVEGIPQEKMSVEQLRGMIAKGGVKADEIKWTGIDDLLAGKKNVTKAEVLEYLRQNEVRVEEVLKPTVIPVGPGYTEIAQAKYATYTLPGAENYRELLLTLPGGEQGTPSRFNVYDADGNLVSTLMNRGAISEERARTLASERGGTYEGVDYQTARGYASPHWQEPNVLAHVRFDDRVDADGKKVLFIEEVQSDWHQAGREKGYKGQGRAEVTQLPEGWKVYERSWATDETPEYKYYVGDERGAPISSGANPDEAIANTLNYLSGKTEGTIPPAPFSKTWPELTMKRMLRWAAENGYDRVAWTTGEQQTERYNLAKQIDKIEYGRNSDGTYHMTVWQNGRSIDDLERMNATPEQLRGIVGNEIVAKIEAGEGKASVGPTMQSLVDRGYAVESFQKDNGHWYTRYEDGSEMGQWINKQDAESDAARLKDMLDNSPTLRVLEGEEQLSVGGEGMKTFYDKMLVSAMDKYAKKWGARTGETKIPTKEFPDVAIIGEPGNYYVMDMSVGPGAIYEPLAGRVFQTQEEARKAAWLPNATPIHSLDITPEMRASVMAGQPLFQGARGAVSFAEDGKAILHALSSPDVSTLAHEVAHIFRRDLTADDLVATEKWAGVVDNTWTVEAEEKFAKGFEKYLSEGKAPIKALETVFEQFKTWLAHIYGRMKEYFTGSEINDDMRGVYNRLLEENPDAQAYNITTQTGRAKQGTLFQGAEQLDFEDGRRVPLENNPPDAIKNPLGSVDALHNEAPIHRIEEDGYAQHVQPVLDSLRGYLTEPGNSLPEHVTDLKATLDQDTARQLRGYLHGVYGQLSDTKLAAIRVAESRRDAALLNYSRRYGFDNVLTAIYPYNFWYTRNALNWGLRIIDKPSWLANYYRLRSIGAGQQENKGYPNRLRNKMKIPIPWLPEWAGGGVYVDPMRQTFPFMQLAQPFEKLGEQNNLIARRTEYILQDWAEEEGANPQAVTQALQDKAGPLWDKATAQAKIEIDEEIENPLDFINTIFGMSLPLNWAYQGLRGKADRIGPLPTTRLVRGITAMMGANKGRGYNPEGPLRRALGLPEFDRFGDYRVDRMLANMAAEGLITADAARQAMIDRGQSPNPEAGEAYTQAEARVAKQGAMGLVGGPFQADLFPEGEQRQRAIKNEYDRAAQAWRDGDDSAFRAFFEAYPEYEARLALYKDPEERLKGYLVGEVWDKYMALPDLHKRQASEQLGELFQQAFLDKETRSYDSIDANTLASWARRMGSESLQSIQGAPQGGLELESPETTAAFQKLQDERDARWPEIGSKLNLLYNLPQELQSQYRKMNPEIREYETWRTQYLADNPAIIPYSIGEDNKVAGAKPEIQAQYYQYLAQREQQFPSVMDVQSAYYDNNKPKGFLKANPMLPAYWDWRRAYMAQYPEMIPYIMSTESLTKAVLGNNASTTNVSYAALPNTLALSEKELQQISPALVRQLMAYYSGTALGDGARKELGRLMRLGGRKGSLNEYINGPLKVGLESY